MLVIEAEVSGGLGLVEPVPGVEVCILDAGAAGKERWLDAAAWRRCTERAGARVRRADRDGRLALDAGLGGHHDVVLRVTALVMPSRSADPLAVAPQIVGLGTVALDGGRVRVDAATWREVRRRAGAYAVTGRVTGKDERPVAGALITAFDADAVEHDRLGHAETDAAGRYRIDFLAADFRKAPIGPGEIFDGPDLYFQARTVGGAVLLDEQPLRGHLPGRRDREATTRIDLRVGVAASPARVEAPPAGPRGIARRHAYYTTRWAGPDGKVAPDWRERGRAAIARMRAPTAADDDPGAPPPEQRAAMIDVGAVTATEAPQAASHGSAGHYVRVEGTGDGGATVRVPIDPHRIGHLDPGSLCLFRWDARAAQFRLVVRSGLGGDGTYVFGRVPGDGVYGVFGLPRDQARRTVLETLVEAERVLPLWRAAGLADTDLPRSVARALLPPAVMKAGLLDQPARLALGGMPDVVTDLSLVLGRALGDLPRDAKGKPIGEPAGYPLLMFGLGGLPGGDLPGGDLPGGDLPGGRRGGRVGWEPGDDICPPEWWRRPELEIIRWRDRTPGWRLPPLRPRCACSAWESLGPTNVPGRMKSIAWNPVDTRTAYCAAAGGGVWRSTNRGLDWTPVMGVELSLSMGAVAVAPSNPQVVYAGTGEHHAWGAWGDSDPAGEGIYRSSDGGDDWDLMPAGASTRCSAIVVDPADPDLVYVAGLAGVHRWNRAAGRWDRILAQECTDLVIDPGDSRRLYAAIEGGDGIVRTADARAAAVTWTAFNTGIVFPTTVPRYAKLAICRSNPAVLYASINAEPPAGSDNPWFATSSQVWRWNGTTWQSRGQHGGITYGGWCNTIAVDPTDADHVLVGATGLEESADGGDTWTGRGNGHSDMHAISFCPSDATLTLIANDGGIWRRSGAGDYALSSRGLVTTELYNVGVSQQGGFRLGGSTQDNGVLKSDGPATFVAMGGNEGGLFVVDPNDSRIIYWDPWSGGLMRTTTGRGADGVAATTGMDAVAGGGGGVADIEALAVCPGDSNVVVCAAGGRLYRSTDGAGNWTRRVAATGGGVRRIAFAPGDTQRVYFVNDAGQVWRSTNRGQDWARVSDASLPAGVLGGLAVDWTDPDVLFVSFLGVGTGRGHVWESRDGGVRWRDISGARAHTRLPDLAFCAVVQRRDRPETLYAATDLGVFITQDGGDWWYPFDGGLPNAQITDMAYDGNALYVSTSSRGFWRRVV